MAKQKLAVIGFWVFILITAVIFLYSIFVKKEIPLRYGSPIKLEMFRGEHSKEQDSHHWGGRRGGRGRWGGSGRWGGRWGSDEGGWIGRSIYPVSINCNCPDNYNFIDNQCVNRNSPFDVVEPFCYV